MLKYRKTNRNVEAVMKRIFIKLLSISLCMMMLFLLCSCSVLDKITTNIEDKPTDETTKAPVGDEVPTVKYKRSDLKYTFLTLVEGFEEGVPAQVSYSVFDTSANTLSTVLIPLNTFVSGENKSLGAQIKSYYFSKASEGRSAAIAYTCETLMSLLKTDLLLECDYYIYFDKTSLSDLVNEIGGIKLQIPFDMKFSDGSVIESKDTTLDGENFHKVMCYGSYASGSELDAAKILWSNVFYKLKESVPHDTISLFMLNIRGNLRTNIPKTNGVDIFFLRKLLSLDGELYKFSSADTQALLSGGADVSVICKNSFVDKANSFLDIYDIDIDVADFDPELRFCDTTSNMISAAYNSAAQPTLVHTAHDITLGILKIYSK